MGRKENPPKGRGTINSSGAVHISKKRVGQDVDWQMVETSDAVQLEVAAPPAEPDPPKNVSPAVGGELRLCRHCGETLEKCLKRKPKHCCHLCVRYIWDHPKGD